MMAYAKISIDRVIEANPDMSIGAMAAEAVRDHERTNGCRFEEHAGARAVTFLRLDPALGANTLSEEMRCRLGLALEAMEVGCNRSRSAQERAQGGEDGGGSP